MGMIFVLRTSQFVNEKKLHCELMQVMLVKGFVIAMVNRHDVQLEYCHEYIQIPSHSCGNLSVGAYALSCSDGEITQI